MRSSLPPRRPLQRVCDACKQQQRNHALSKNFTNAAFLSTLTSSRIIPQPQHSKIIQTTRGTQVSSALIPQTRRISSSAASSAREAALEAAEAEAEGESGRAAETNEPKITRTHYDLFPQTLPKGPPPKGPFAIDVRELRREFLTLQATAHPDLAPPGPEKRRAEAASSLINEAYRTLTHPLLRAQYLLNLRGIDVANEETARVEDPALLMLVLETREAIEEAGAEEELEPLRLENEARIAESEGRLARAFEEGDVKGARVEVTRLRYWVNIRETIRNWELGKPVVLQH
ncbi:Co-chaperone Hsc20 [Jackrogersella minutella]|nr:Co-chaperone Hsc20 [Jackrogersella minutella]